MNEELKNYFRPEFLNRLDEIIVFRQLNKQEVREIADIMLEHVFKRLKEKDIALDVTERFKDGSSTRGSTRRTARGRCVAPSCACWRTTSPRRCSR